MEVVIEEQVPVTAGGRQGREVGGGGRHQAFQAKGTDWLEVQGMGLDRAQELTGTPTQRMSSMEATLRRAGFIPRA